MLSGFSESSFKRHLSSPRTAYLAAIISAVLGLFFIFVWSPLPWGWKGFDGYHELGLALARGEGYPTMFRIWGYPSFLALFYRLLGDYPVVPLVVQTMLNALIPIMIYRLVRMEMNGLVAGLSALISGVFSLSTVYASTQSADTLSTVFFVAGVLLFSMGNKYQGSKYFALSGIVFALACQFRPNLIIFPFFLGAIYLAARGWRKGKIRQVFVCLTLFILCNLPWVIRNYKVSGLFQPTPTHGALVFWFGSLQVGPYTDNWIENPRSVFINPIFEYTIYEKFPLIIRLQDENPPAEDRGLTRLVFWTNRDTIRSRLSPVEKNNGLLTYLIPPRKAPAGVYYYFENRGYTDSGQDTVQFFPPDGPEDPLIHFVNKDHLGDADLSGDFLDVFDVIRMLRHIFLSQELPFKDRLDFDRDGEVTETDVRLAAGLLLPARRVNNPEHKLSERIDEIRDETDSTLVTFLDGSRMAIPHGYSGKITDILVERGKTEHLLFCEAGKLLTSRLTFVRVRRELNLITGTQQNGSTGPGPVGRAGRSFAKGMSSQVNQVFFRSEPQRQHRIISLAVDNIRRQPWKYLQSRLFQVYRLFVIKGSRDAFTAHQFPGSGYVYGIAFLVTLAVFLAMLAGVVIAFKKQYSVLIILTPVVYIILTLGLLQANTRFSMAVQPFLLVFFAISVEALLKKLGLFSAEENT